MVESKAAKGVVEEDREDRKRRREKSGKDEEKEIKRLKRHNATVLHVYSQKGINGTEFISCSADHIVRGKQATFYDNRN